MLRLGLAIALFLAAASPVAGEVSLALSQPAGTAVVESEAIPITATVTVDCQTLAVRTEDAERQVTFTIDAPDYLVVTGPTQDTLTTEQCSGISGSATLTNEFNALLTREAPGLRALPFKMDVELAPHATDDLMDTQRTATDSATVMAAPYFLVEPRVAQKLVRVENDTATVTIELANHGNVRTKVVATPAVATPPQGTMDGGEIVLESLYGGDPGGSISGNLHLTFHAPPGDWGQIAVQILLASSAVEDATAVGDPLHANVLFTNGDASDRDSPLPPTPWLGLVLALFAILARRRA